MVGGRATGSWGGSRAEHVLMFALAAVLLVAPACGQDRTSSRFRTARFTAIEIQRDVPYGTEPEQLLDVYRPAGDRENDRPALVWVHGGGFAEGSKGEGPLASIPSDFAELGYVAVSIDYTMLAAHACIAQHLPDPECADAIAAAADDATVAVTWLKTNAAAYGIDPTRIAIAGESAGGITAATVATRGSGREQVRAFVSISGGLPDASVVDAGDAPGCLMASSQDPWIPYEWSTTVNDALKAAGLATELRTFDGVSHVPVDQYGAEMREGARDFLYEQLDLAALS